MVIFIRKKELRIPINDKAYSILKVLSRRRGEPMCHVARNFLYGGLNRYLNSIRREIANDIIEKAKQEDLQKQEW